MTTEAAHDRQIAALRYGDHVAHFYTQRDEALAAAVPFVKLGLESGDRVLYITGELPIEQVSAALAAAGVAVEEARARGALVLQATYQVPTSDGAFDFAAVYAELQALIDQAQTEGYRGVRLVAEMTWALAVQEGSDWLTTYEANGNHLLDTNPFIVLCQYRRDRFDPRVVHDMLHTHPWALIEGRLCPNLYFERPELVLDPQATAAKVDWMLAQLVRARDMEAEHTRLLREQMLRVAAVEGQRRLQEFLGMVTHELGNALSSMLANAQMLRAVAGTPSASPTGATGSASEARGPTASPDAAGRVDARVRALEAAERRVRRLLDDLRDASLIGSGAFTVKPQAMNLLAVARRVRETQAEADQRPVRLEVRGDEAELRGEWDEERISQVLANLVSNAIKYSPPSSEVAIVLEAPSPPRGDQPRELIVRVADRGAGMTSEQIASLFQPFARLEQDSSTKGTGLGLYICKGIVEAHGGRIWVESVPGAGSTFCVALPMTTVAGAAPLPVPGAEDQPAPAASLRKQMVRAGDQTAQSA